MSKGSCEAAESAEGAALRMAHLNCYYFYLHFRKELPGSRIIKLLKELMKIANIGNIDCNGS